MTAFAAVTGALTASKVLAASKAIAASKVLAALDRNAFSLLGMLVTVVLILLLAYWVTRFIGQRGLPGWARGVQDRGELQVLWQLSLGKGERLALVRLHERCLLLGVSGGGITLLTELSPEEAALWLKKQGEDPKVPSFLEILRDNLPKRK